MRLRLFVARRVVGMWNFAVKRCERGLRRAYDRLVSLEHQDDQS